MINTCLKLRSIGLTKLINKRAFRIKSILRSDESTKGENDEVIVDETDVLIIGGGPAGLSAAIKFKQKCNELGKDYRVVLVEKGADIGSHILSGAVVEPTALNELIPDWKDKDCPLKQKATKDQMRLLFENSSIPLPMPPTFHNKNKNYIGSLSQFCKWLSTQAEDLGVEIYTGCSGSKLIYNEDESGVLGVKTGDLGISKSGKKKDSYEPGMELRSKITLLGEGAHGSLTKMAINKFNLRKDVGPQTYALGLKEVWELNDSSEAKKFLESTNGGGLVLHTVGYPMSYDTYGGGWLYTFDEKYISVGLAIGLNYKNPYLNTYQEFQKFKLHPLIKNILQNANVISYGARVLVEGGLQKIPNLNINGLALIGDSAGFLNAAKIKETHTAMKSGILAAESIIEKFENSTNETINLDNYFPKVKNSWLYKDLHKARNLIPSFHTSLGLYGGLLYSGIDSLILRGNAPWTLKHSSKGDYEKLQPIKDAKPIKYNKKPDNKITFSLLESVSRTNTNHEEDQPSHLKLKDPKITLTRNWNEFGGPEQNFCPAGVYEYLNDDPNSHNNTSVFSSKKLNIDNSNKKFQINFQNCIHCKTCDIKCPSQNINWTTPEGSGGPKYFMT